MSILNIIILMFQTIILLGQLLLSRKINEQAISKEKGYFVIEETNYNVNDENFGRFRDKFKLKEKGIGFYVDGNADVILLGVEYSINNIQRQNATPRETYYTCNRRFNKFLLELDIREADYNSNDINVDIHMQLKNPVGFKYTQTINIQFKRYASGDAWIIHKYNMTFK